MITNTMQMYIRFRYFQINFTNKLLKYILIFLTHENLVISISIYTFAETNSIYGT